MRVSFPKLLAALVVFAALNGCATPRYQTTFRLVPPADPAGQACVQGCDAKRATCQADCKTRYEACTKAVAPQVEARYNEALKNYELELKRYAAALRRYELQLHFEWMHSHPYRRYPPYWWDPWPGPYFPPPFAEPLMPTREGVRAELEKKNCQADCGCLPAYDSCFVSCGGHRVRETVCIKNCPAAK